MKTILILWLAYLCLTACSDGQTEQASGTEPATEVTLTHPVRGCIPQETLLTATTSYQCKTTVTSPIASFVTEVQVKPGTRVQTGQTLYRLQSKERHALGSNESLIDITAERNGIVLDVQAQPGSYAAEGTTLCTLVEAAMTGGLQIGSVQDGEQMRRILLRFTDFPDNSPELLRRQPVFLPDGSIRPLETLCDIRIIPGEIEQRREDLKSNITLTARLEGRDLGSAVQDLQREFKQQLHLPSGYSISFGGAYSEQQQSFRELTAILLLATLLVLTVLMFLLREWRISFAVLFISLMGICGCLLALWITGVPLNVSSYTGIIMIVGILAENSIFTVWQYKTNRRNGGTVDESVDYAIALRIRPKLMTAIFAKVGVKEINSDLATAIRTTVILFVT